MRKKWLIFVAAMTILSITACGSGDGIVINGTTAAEEAESDQLEEEGEGSVAEAETTSGTRIEIITGDTTAAFSTEETAAASTEAWTEAEQTQPATTAAPQTTSATKAVVETTAAKKYKVTDVKKTMYATASVRVRANYSTSSDVVAALADGEKVDVTGQAENGWMRVSYKGNVGYVSGSYLSETPPATKSSAANSANQGSSQTKPATGNHSKPSTTTGTGTTPGGTTGPTAGNNSGAATGPSAGGNSGQNTSPGGATGPSAGNSSGTANPGGSSSSGGSSVSGTVTSLDPSGVTIQSSSGTSYQFVWGNNAPDLVTGDQVHISYETTSSGEKKITSVSK